MALEGRVLEGRVRPGVRGRRRVSSTNPNLECGGGEGRLPVAEGGAWLGLGLGLGSVLRLGSGSGSGLRLGFVAGGRAAELVDHVLGHCGAAREVEARGRVVVGAGQRHDDASAYGEGERVGARVRVRVRVGFR